MCYILTEIAANDDDDDFVNRFRKKINIFGFG